MRRERDSQPLRTTYLQEEKSWRSEGGEKHGISVLSSGQLGVGAPDSSH